MCKPKVPKPTPPAQAAPIANNAATVNQNAPESPDEVDSDKAALKARRKGRSGLRINLDANTGGTANGLNIPKG